MVRTVQYREITNQAQLNLLIRQITSDKLLIYSTIFHETNPNLAPLFYCCRRQREVSSEILKTVCTCALFNRKLVIYGVGEVQGESEKEYYVAFSIDK